MADNSATWWPRGEVRRRDFLGGLAVGVAGIAASSMGASAMLAPPKQQGTGLRAGPLPDGWLATRGSNIVGADGSAVRLVGFNWAGGETSGMVPGGLHLRSVREICTTIAATGANVIRVPFSVQGMLHSGPVSPAEVDKSELVGLTPRQAFHELVRIAGECGLRVLLDRHRADANWGPQGNGLWYTPAFPAAVGREVLFELAEEYKNDPTVIGFDLWNEPGSPPYDGTLPSDSGALWGYGAWSPDGVDARDWAREAEYTGGLLHEINPRLLLVVEGVRYDPAGPIYGGQDNLYWGGGNLTGVLAAGGERQEPRPLDLHNLVYSAHDYPPSFYREPWDATDPEAVWERTWGGIARQGIGPIWMGETGLPHSTLRADEDYQYIVHLVNYLNDLGGHATFWDLNGTYPPDAPHPGGVEPYGWLDATWTRPASPLLIDLFSTMVQPASQRGIHGQSHG